MNFEKLKLSFGDILQLQFIDNPLERYTVRLIGYLRSRSVIVTQPFYNGRPAAVVPGREVNVRFLAERTATAFSSHIESVTSTPYPHIHIGYPKSIEQNEVRQSPRISTELITSVINTSADAIKQSGIIRDISISGARLELKATGGNIGDFVELACQVNIKKYDRILKISGIIRSKFTSPMKNSRMYYYGVEFLPLDENSFIYLHAYIYTLIVDGNY